MKEGGLSMRRRAVPVAALEVLAALGLLGVVSALAVAAVDLPRLRSVRGQLPALRHRRLGDA